MTSGAGEAQPLTAEAWERLRASARLLVKGRLTGRAYLDLVAALDALDDAPVPRAALATTSAGDAGDGLAPENERQAIAHDRAWQSGYAAGRAAALRAARPPWMTRGGRACASPGLSSGFESDMTKPTDRTTHPAADRLSAASEKLLADFDRTPDAIDHDELAARLWLIEQEVRAALRALPSEQAAGGDGLREMAEQHLSRRDPPPGHPAYREPELPASEWRAAYFVLARIAQEQLDKAWAELAAAAPASPPVERVARGVHGGDDACSECGVPINEHPVTDACWERAARRAPAAGDGERRDG